MVRMMMIINIKLKPVHHHPKLSCIHNAHGKKHYLSIEVTEADKVMDYGHLRHLRSKFSSDLICNLSVTFMCNHSHRAIITFTSLFGRYRISSQGEEIIWFFCFQIDFYIGILRFYFPLFSQMSAVIVQKRKFCCIWFRFALRSQLTHFCIFNFSASIGHSVTR